MRKYLLLLLPFLGACAAAVPQDTGSSPLWQSARVERIVGHDFPQDALAQTEFGLLNEKNDDGTRGYAYMGCNRIGFEVVFTAPDKVRFENGFSTRMACHDSGLEDTFLSLINEIDSYRTEQGRLILQKEGKPVLILVPR